MAHKQNSTKGQEGTGRFEPRGDLEALESRSAREERLNLLPSPEKNLAEECTRFADLCQCFEQQKMDVPAEMIDQLRRAAKLAVPERIEAMKRLNQRLMEYLDAAGKGAVVRQ